MLRTKRLLTTCLSKWHTDTYVVQTTFYSTSILRVSPFHHKMTNLTCRFKFNTCGDALGPVSQPVCTYSEVSMKEHRKCCLPLGNGFTDDFIERSLGWGQKVVLAVQQPVKIKVNPWFLHLESLVFSRNVLKFHSLWSEVVLRFGEFLAGNGWKALLRTSVLFYPIKIKFWNQVVLWAWPQVDFGDVM